MMIKEAPKPTLIEKGPETNHDLSLLPFDFSSLIIEVLNVYSNITQAETKFNPQELNRHTLNLANLITSRILSAYQQISPSTEPDDKKYFNQIPWQTITNHCSLIREELHPLKKQLECHFLLGSLIKNQAASSPDLFWQSVVNFLVNQNSKREKPFTLEQVIEASFFWLAELNPELSLNQATQALDEIGQICPEKYHTNQFYQKLKEKMAQELEIDRLYKLCLYFHLDFDQLRAAKPLLVVNTQEVLTGIDRVKYEVEQTKQRCLEFDYEAAILKVESELQEIEKIVDNPTASIAIDTARLNNIIDYRLNKRAAAMAIASGVVCFALLILPQLAWADGEIIAKKGPCNDFQILHGCKVVTMNEALPEYDLEPGDQTCARVTDQSRNPLCTPLGLRTLNTNLHQDSFTIDDPQPLSFTAAEQVKPWPYTDPLLYPWKPNKINDCFVVAALKQAFGGSVLAGDQVWVTKLSPDPRSMVKLCNINGEPVGPYEVFDETRVSQATVRCSTPEQLVNCQNITLTDSPLNNNLDTRRITLAGTKWCAQQVGGVWAVCNNSGQPLPPDFFPRFDNGIVTTETLEADPYQSREQMPCNQNPEYNPAIAYHQTIPESVIRGWYGSAECKDDVKKCQPGYPKSMSREQLEQGQAANEKMSKTDSNNKNLADKIIFWGPVSIFIGICFYALAKAGEYKPSSSQSISSASSKNKGRSQLKTSVQKPPSQISLTKGPSVYETERALQGKNPLVKVMSTERWTRIDGRRHMSRDINPRDDLDRLKSKAQGKRGSHELVLKAQDYVTVIFANGGKQTLAPGQTTLLGEPKVGYGGLKTENLPATRIRKATRDERDSAEHHQGPATIFVGSHTKNLVDSGAVVCHSRETSPRPGGGYDRIVNPTISQKGAREAEVYLVGKKDGSDFRYSTPNGHGKIHLDEDRRYLADKVPLDHLGKPILDDIQVKEK